MNIETTLSICYAKESYSTYLRQCIGIYYDMHGDSSEEEIIKQEMLRFLKGTRNWSEDTNLEPTVKQYFTLAKDFCSTLCRCGISIECMTSAKDSPFFYGI